MSRSLMQHTQVGVSLSLAIVTKTDNDNRLNLAHLADVTQFVFWLWSWGQTVDRLLTRAAHLAARGVFSVEQTYYQVIGWLAEPVTLPCQKPLSKTLAKNLRGWYGAVVQQGERLTGFWQTFLTGGRVKR